MHATPAHTHTHTPFSRLTQLRQGDPSQAHPEKQSITVQIKKQLPLAISPLHQQHNWSAGSQRAVKACTGICITRKNVCELVQKMEGMGKLAWFERCVYMPLARHPTYLHYMCTRFTTDCTLNVAHCPSLLTVNSLLLDLNKTYYQATHRGTRATTEQIS